MVAAWECVLRHERASWFEVRAPCWLLCVRYTGALCSSLSLKKRNESATGDLSARQPNVRSCEAKGRAGRAAAS